MALEREILYVTYISICSYVYTIYKHIVDRMPKNRSLVAPCGKDWAQRMQRIIDARRVQNPTASQLHRPVSAMAASGFDGWRVEPSPTSGLKP